VPRFAANLTTMFADLPVGERFDAARRFGFHAVEYLFPYADRPADLRRWAGEAGVEVILVNTPLGDAANGERGRAALPGREDDFRADFERALEYATALGAPMIHVMAGVVDENDRVAARRALVANVRMAAELAAQEDVRVLLEPLNSEDTPGYLLTYTDETRAVIDAVGRANVQLQFDFYHRQIMEGNLARRLADNVDVIGHIQASSVPGRHEPCFGEINYGHLFAECDRLGYAGWIGAEYRPRTTVAAGIGWGERYGLGEQA
jgi:hydroxypyruvate isomerase